MFTIPQESAAVPGSKLVVILQQLHSLDLMYPAETVISEVLFVQAKGKVIACKSRFNMPLLDEVVRWLDEEGDRYLRTVLYPHAMTGDHFDLMLALTQPTDAANPIHQQWRTRLKFFIYESFCSLR